VRAVLPIAAIAILALLISGCGGDEDTHESLAGTPAAIHIVKDV
jgi:PBP1b-binding outer membrane lipoprotein LpoB